MLSIAAILTLALPAAAGEEGVRALERLPIPPGPVSLRVLPLEARVVVGTAKPAELARALRELSPAICPRLEVGRGEVRLSCRTQRLAAAVLPQGSGQALELRELAGLPVAGDEGFPLLPFDPEALGLGSCPGETPTAQGECLLRAGDRAAARTAFSEAQGPEARGLAALRLGDLAALAGDLGAAGALWRQAELEPWRRLASARACEISSCAVVEEADVAFSAAGLPPLLAADVAVRGARALAFQGKLAESAARLRATPTACAALPLLCDRVLLAALRSSPAQAEAGMAVYLSIPEREKLPLGRELAERAAALSEEQGAPAFGAALLGAISARVPPAELEAHLLRTAELYVAGGDQARAGVIVEYARIHAGARALAAPRWKAVARALVTHRKASPKRLAAAPAAPPAAGELEAAQAALTRARAQAVQP